VKPWLLGLACLAALLVSDCSGAPPTAPEDPPRHWCMHELHRALGRWLFPSTP